MTRYRKKPVVIEAFCLGVDVWPDWAWEQVVNNQIVTHGDGAMFGTELTYADINTLEGTMRAEHGDYIIRGIAGEIYPCKPDIFKESYDEVNDGLD